MSVNDMQNHAIECFEEGLVDEFSIFVIGILTIGPLMNLKFLDAVLGHFH